MCISFPGRVVAVEGSCATVELPGGLRRSSTLLVPDVVVGDLVAVAAGTIVSRLDAEEAEELTTLLRPMLELEGGSRVQA